MALVVNDRVQQTGTANTTVSFTLSGSVTGFQSFAVVGNGNTTYYAATDASGNWEVGIGTYATGGTLTRTTILSSSNSGSAVTFSGTVNVFVTYPSEKSINYDASDVATIGSVLNYSDTGIIGSFASTVAGYNQVIVQNKSSATNASSNLNVSNNTSTSTTGYAEFGINSSTFTGTGSFNIAGAAYVASASTDLTIGTYGAYNVHFVTNSNTTDAMTIYNSGGISLGGYADPGIGTLYANNVYLGFNPITSAAGTTVLTNASAAYQNVVGTLTQTIQLPNATTLYKGLAFTVANASTGAVTIKNNASTTIDTIVTGGTSVLVLTDNSTTAGTWVAYSYVPATYDFNTATANFGTATITNATWNGVTIATGYGGTGLTSFSAANNAIYSTSSSALTAGTLPIAAGGTSATTAAAAFNALSPLTTAGDTLYGGASGAGTRLAIGTAGQVLAVNPGGTAPVWSSTYAGTVTSVGQSFTGGIISVAGSPITSSGTLALTVAGTSGGIPYFSSGTTWATSAALGQYGVVYGGGAGAAPVSTAAGTTGQVLLATTSAAPSWGQVSLTAGVTGTLPVANGGTGATTLTGVLKGNGTSALTAATAGTDFVAPGTATTFTATQSFTGSTSVLAAILTNTAEVATVSATAATGTIAFYPSTQSVLYYTSNASANWTVNFTFSSGVTLNTAMSTGQAITVAFLVTQGATAYYNSAVQVDGSAVTPKWQGGTAPTAGNASGIDVYTYTIIKTASATFTVLASQTQFK
jgi:hypothetical protein